MTNSSLRKQATLCTIIGMMSLSSVATARIGETEAEIHVRYGQPLPLEKITPLSPDVYEVAALQVFVTFLDGVSESETFQKLGGSQFSAAEIQMLLEANGGGAKWEEDTSDFSDGDKRWSLAGNTRRAHWRKDKARLLIYSDKYLRAVAASGVKARGRL